MKRAIIIHIHHVVTLSQRSWGTSPDPQALMPTWVAQQEGRLVCKYSCINSPKKFTSEEPAQVCKHSGKSWLNPLKGRGVSLLHFAIQV